MRKVSLIKRTNTLTPKNTFKKTKDCFADESANSGSTVQLQAFFYVKQILTFLAGEFTCVVIYFC
jgi:hypothetical protein